MIINPKLSALVAEALDVPSIAAPTSAKEIFSFWRSLSHLYGARRASELTASEFGLSEADIVLVVSSCYQSVASGKMQLE